MIAFIIFLSDAPQVSLRLGRTLDADNIRTGHDVYFECDVKANPPALRLEWLHNVSMALIIEKANSLFFFTRISHTIFECRYTDFYGLCNVFFEL